MRSFVLLYFSVAPTQKFLIWMFFLQNACNFSMCHWNITGKSFEVDSHRGGLWRHFQGIPVWKPKIGWMNSIEMEFFSLRKRCTQRICTRISKNLQYTSRDFNLYETIQSIVDDAETIELNSLKLQKNKRYKKKMQCVFWFLSRTYR